VTRPARAERGRFRLPALDYPILIAVLGLVGLGLLTVYSATSIQGAHEGLWMRQLGWAGLALVAAWVAAVIHYRAYDALAWPLYGLALFFLVLVLVMGTSAYGAKRWLDLGPIKFQPSELAKIATVIVLARVLDHPNLNLRRIRWWLPPMLLALVPFLLVLKEPDLGTSLSFPVLLVAMYYWAGMPLSTLVMGLSPALNVVLFFATGSIVWFVVLLAGMLALIRPRLPVLALVLAVNGGVALYVPQAWNHLHDYQKRRIETFLNPGEDPHGAGYQIIQSKIAMGSGGVTGKGYLKGSQKALAFLPMRHTDFIYSVIGEELGLVGTLLVVILYGVVLIRSLRVATATRNGFASLMVVGLTTALFYHVGVNILMTIGWAPVTGLPLPLLSYGGTALIVNGIEIGLILNVAMRRMEF
jgi:rod shape determining protein RodA